MFEKLFVKYRAIIRHKNDSLVKWSAANNLSIVQNESKCSGELLATQNENGKTMETR